MKPQAALALLILFCLGAAPAAQGPRRAPIIDVHLHALPADEFGPPGAPNPATGKPSAATTDEAIREASLAALERYNIVRAVTSGQADFARQWKAAAPDRIIASPLFPWKGYWPDVASLRAAYAAGELGAMGELTLQYEGLTLSSPEMEPYLALAEERDIPVAVHSGFGPPGVTYDPCCPKYRASLGNPLHIEAALARHPKLRLYIMHAGFPFLEETIALLHAYPQVYADLAVINWVLPREQFHEYVRRLVQHPGVAQRLMFGSDQMIWPEAISMAVENIESAAFLTAEQKRDIFCRNAARFLRLDAALCE